MSLDDAAGRSPVSGWTAISVSTTEDTHKANLERVESQVDMDSNLKYFSEKLRHYLLSMGGNRNEDLSASDEINVRVLSLMNRVRPILETAIRPVEVLKANWRNKKLIQAKEQPIKIGSHLHGLSIEYLDNSHEAIVASELYTGEESYNILPLRVYTSYVTNDDVSHGLDKLVESTHTGSYGMKSGTVTLIFANDGRLGSPKTTYMASKPNSHAVATPLGVPSTEITGCIVFNKDDEKTVVEKISKFPFPIPVYNASGEIIFPPQASS